MNKVDFNDFLEKLKRDIHIEDVIQHLGVEVKQIGNRKIALCPFHDDTKPSLEIYFANDNIPQYHCFTCNAHGDSIKFVQEKQSCSFKDAVIWLVEEFNYSFDLAKFKKNDVSNWIHPNQFAYDLFLKNNNKDLLTIWAEEKRKINVESINNAGVLSLKGNALLKTLNTLSYYEIGLLEDAGVIQFFRQIGKDKKQIVKDKNGKYLRLPSVPSEIFWYQNILFPMKDSKGNITGFAAREDDQDKATYNIPKYKYSKGFKRASNLYGIDNVYNKIKDHKQKNKSSKKLAKAFHLYLVEGMMDVLRLESRNVSAIGALGNRLAGNIEDDNKQLDLIRKICEFLDDAPLCLHLFLDNDQAGRDGAYATYKSLLDLKNKYNLLLHIDVVIPPKDITQKDPDEIFKNNPERISSKKWCHSITDFEVAYILDCHIDDIDDNYKNLTFLQKGQVERKIQSHLETKSFDEDITSNTFGVKSIIHFKQKTSNAFLITEGSSEEGVDKEKFIQDIQKAVSQCEKSYRVDFPIDYKSWSRLQKAGIILIDEFKKMLNPHYTPEAFTGVLHPREKGEPRLLTLPSPELLIAEEYLLNELVNHSMQNPLSKLPFVFYDNEKQKHETTGTKKQVAKDKGTVSFAYQIEREALAKNTGVGETLFRHYSRCWDDYNKYILNRIRKCPKNIDILFPARLDLHRYYDNIKKSLIVDSLKPALDETLPKVQGYENTASIMQWICSATFGYSYYAPNGEILKSPYIDKGIPQGPNLSAWLGNIVLFSVDKIMSDEVEKINAKYKAFDHDGIVATYARYVDDIVLIAPDASSLMYLQQTFASAISQLGLSLSSKTPAMEPQSVENLKSWLSGNRGFGQRPSGNWSPNNIIDSSDSLMRAFWLKSINRKQALSLLHDDRMNVSFDAKEIEIVLNIVLEKYDDLRYRDYRYISARIWRMCCLECEKGNRNNIISKYIDKIVKYLKINEQHKTSGEIESKNLLDFVDGLNIVWRLLLSIESLQEIVINRNVSFFRYTKEEQSNYLQFVENIIDLIKKNNLLDTLCKEYFAKFNVHESYQKQFSFLINLRKLAVLQILKKRKDLPGEYQIEKYPLLQRFALSVSKTIGLAALRTFDLDKIENKFLFFHEAIEFLELSNEHGKDEMEALLERATSKNDLLCKSVYCLCPCKLDKKIIDNTPDDTNIKLNALQVFANCVTKVDIQFSLLATRKTLVALLASEDNDKLFILPHPNGLNRNFIKCVIWADDEKSQIASFMAITKKKEIDNIITLGPNSIKKYWGSVPKKGINQLCICTNTAKENLSLTISTTKKIKTSTEKLEKLIEIYNNLISNNSFDQNLITPFHIVKNEDKDIYEIYSSEFLEGNERKNRGYGANHYQDLIPIEVPEHNSLYWRVGVAVAGLFDLNKKILNLEHCGLNSQAVSSNIDIDDDMAEFVSKQALYIFSGSKYWSKSPRNSKIPFAITDCRENIKKFLSAKDKKNKILICLYMNAKTRLMSLMHGYKHKLNEKGIGTFIYKRLSSQILLNNPSFIENIIQLEDALNASKLEFTRDILLLRRLIGIFENFKSEEGDYIANAYQACLIDKIYRTIALSLKLHVNSQVVEKSNDFLEILDLPTDILLATWHDPVNDDFKDFLSSFNRLINEPVYPTSQVEDITPLGWCVLALYHLFKLKGDEEFEKMLSELDDKKNIYSGLTLEYNVGDNSFPWCFESKEGIEKSCNCALSLFANLISEKVIEIKPTNFEKRMLLEAQGNSVQFMSSKGEISLQQWQFSFEQIVGEPPNAFEKVALDDESSNYCWSEIYCFGKLAFISILSEKLGEILRSKQVCTAINENSKIEKTKDVKKQPQKIVSNNNVNNDNIDNYSTDNSENFEERNEDYLKEFANIQKGLWEGRRTRMGRHIRTALFQFNVNGFDTYRHPLTEICEICDLPEDFEGKIQNYKKHPEKYSDRIAEDNNTGKNYKIKSCAEYRRQQILRKIIDTCNAFSVDLLLLPEYSIRPETVLAIQEILKEKDSKLIVWAGTYRLPYFGIPIAKNIEPMMSPLHVVSSEIDSWESWRSKKYPAVALGEIFNPYDSKIEPIFNTQEKKTGNFIYELICAENFCITSPINRNGMFHSRNQLLQIFGKSGSGTEAGIDDDLKSISNWISLANTTKDKDFEEYRWLKYYPRRSILFIPAMTTRSVDYHYLGQANYLAAGVCSVFCNTSDISDNNFSSGESCFVGHGSTFKDKALPFLPGRLGPYNNAFPGIYKPRHFNDGALGKKDQALVIADIDPEYQNEGKPRQQMLIPPLRLIAHIPVFEISKKENVSEKIKCSCKGEKINENIASGVCKDIIETINVFIENKNQGNDIPTKYSDAFNVTLKNITDAFKGKDSWIKVKCNEYLNHQYILPSEGPPAVLYDMLFVNTSIVGINGNEIPDIEVPPVCIAFNETEKKDE